MSQIAFEREIRQCLILERKGAAVPNHDATKLTEQPPQAKRYRCRAITQMTLRRILCSKRARQSCQNVSQVLTLGFLVRPGNLWVSLSSDRWRLADLQESVEVPAGGIKGTLLLLGAMVDEGSAVIATRA